MPGYAHPNCYYQLVENFRVYLQAKNQFHPTCLSGDLAKIIKLLILGTLGMPGYIHPKLSFWVYATKHAQSVEHFNAYLHAKNRLHHSLLS